MRIAIITHSPYGNAGDNISNNLFCKVFIEMGHECKMIPFANLWWSSANSENSYLESDGLLPRIDEVLHDIDIIIPRIDARSAGELEWILTIMEGVIDKGIGSIIDIQTFRNAEDKGRAALLLTKNNIPTPMGNIIGFYPGIELNGFKQQISNLLGYPLILKHPYGWGGMGVIKIDSSDAFASTLDFIGQLGYRGALLIQEFIPHDCCISVAVVDNQIVSVTAKMPCKDFRCKGGMNINENLPKEEEELVLNVAKIFGIKAATIDYLRSKKGPLVLEVNACPGLCDPEDVPFVRAVTNYLEHKFSFGAGAEPFMSVPVQ